MTFTLSSPEGDAGIAVQILVVLYSGARSGAFLLEESCSRWRECKSTQKLLMQLTDNSHNSHFCKGSQRLRRLQTNAEPDPGCQAAHDTNLLATRSFNHYWMQCNTGLLPNCCAPVVVIPTTWASLRMQRSSCSRSSVSLSAAA